MSTPATPQNFSPTRLPPGSSEEHVRSLQLLNDAAHTINSILELDDLLYKIVNEVTAAFDCTLSGISLVDPESGDLVSAAAQGGVEPNGVHYRVGIDGITGHVAATGRMHYAPDVLQDPYYRQCTPGTRSEIGIPLKVGNELIGVFSVQHRDMDAFSPEHCHVFQVLANHIAIAVKNARLFQRERAEKQQLFSEQQEAAAIQRALFPKASPLIPGLQVHGRCSSARAVGGDWFDYIPLPDGRWAFVLADVSGKGMPAALLMTSSRGILRSLVETTPSPAALLTRLNRILYNDFPPEKFVTLIYAVFDPNTRSLTFSNAGHPWPIFVNGHGPQLLKTGCGLPLGIAECEYDESTVDFADNARILLYSDGITEAQDHSGEELGLDRLMHYASEPDLSVDTLLESICGFTECRPPVDDATVIVLKAI